MQIQSILESGIQSEEKSLGEEKNVYIEVTFQISFPN